MSDIYNTPKAELQEKIEPSEYGSIERAIEGRYNFEIGAIIKEAWQKTSGAKLQIMIATLLVSLISFAVSFASEFLIGQLGTVGIIANQLVITLLTTPLAVGLMILGVRRSVGSPIEFSQVFNYYNKSLPLFVLYVVMTILILLGLVLLIIPGVYLAIAYSMALPLMIEKDIGIWESLETSRKAVTKKWFPFFGFFIVIVLIILTGALALGIGLIWAFPLTTIAYGIAYRNMFGVEEKTLNS